MRKVLHLITTFISGIVSSPTGRVHNYSLCHIKF